MAIERARTAFRRLWVSLAFAGLVAGCSQPETGPKREGYKEATTPHYNPDMARRVATSQPTATMPGDVQFGAVGVGSPVMMVNGEPVTVQELLEPIIDDLAEKAKSLTEAGYRKYLTDKIIEHTSKEISSVLVYQEAKKTFPDNMDEQFAKATDKIIQERIDAHFGGVRARYEAHLKGLDLTVKEMKERAKRQLMVSQFLSQRFKPMIQPPSRGELLKYYRQHEADFTTPPKAELFLIEIPFEAELRKPLDAVTSDELAAARVSIIEQLRKARQELESGIPFGDVARQYSKGLQAALGGAIGEISPGTLTRHWVKAGETLFTLAEGQMAGPIETDVSIFLIKCGKKTPAHKTTFEESQKQIEDKLMEAEFNEMTTKYLMGLEAKATVVRRPEFMMAVFAAAPRPPGYVGK